MMEKWDAGTLDFKPASSRAIYSIQIDAMERYIVVLELRASTEKIDLSK